MCRQVSCRRCGKATWAGCGAHVDQVMRGVPQAQRCSCAKATASTPAASDSSGATGGFLSRLLGR